MFLLQEPFQEEEVVLLGSIVREPADSLELPIWPRHASLVGGIPLPLSASSYDKIR